MFNQITEYNVLCTIHEQKTVPMKIIRTIGRSLEAKSLKWKLLNIITINNYFIHIFNVHLFVYYILNYLDDFPKFYNFWFIWSTYFPPALALMPHNYTRLYFHVFFQCCRSFDWHRPSFHQSFDWMCFLCF